MPIDTTFCPFQRLAEGHRVECLPLSCGIYSTVEHNCSMLVIAESLARLFDKFMGKDPVLDVAGPDPDPGIHGRGQ